VRALRISIGFSISVFVLVLVTSPNQSITTSFCIMTSGDFLFLSSSFQVLPATEMLFAVASYNFLRISNGRQQEKWKRGVTMGGEAWIAQKKYILIFSILL